MIKNVLTGRKESNTYGYCQQTSLESADNNENISNVVAFSQHCGLHQLKRLQLMKVTVLAESYILSIFIAICRLQRCLLTVARQMSLSFLLVNILLGKLMFLQFLLGFLFTFLSLRILSNFDIVDIPLPECKTIFISLIYIYFTVRQNGANIWRLLMLHISTSSAINTLV